MAQTHGRRIVLGITGGIAAYKAAELVRLQWFGDYAVHISEAPRRQDAA